MEDRFSSLYDHLEAANAIDAEYFRKPRVKRGLRNADGTGVIAGVTNISNVHGYVISDDRKMPVDGHLTFRGYDIEDLVENVFGEGRFGFEEVAYLLMCGKLPTREELLLFEAAIDEQRELPDGFTEQMIMGTTSVNIMNVLARSVLMLYATAPNPEDRSYRNEMMTAISLLSRLPRIMVLAWYAKQAKFHNGSMIIHPFIPGQDTAETILSMLRPDRQFAPEEARMLDVLMTLHAEHGGGNNSTFTCRVLSSADTDPYSAYAAAIGSLKGAKHGGANHKVRAMQAEIKENVKDWENDDELAAYLAKIVNKQAFDHTGLVYGMGHAVYTKSDPRAVICKRYASKLAEGTEFEEEYKLLESIERLSPQVMAQERGITKTMCANIDMYTGFVYNMMGIPEDLYTPIFACSRMAGWAAHRFEEIISGKRIMRPAYGTTVLDRPFIYIDDRK
ncbi:MAG: citrate/2-methylcitrate synthase [Coriobacteriaceae bacterium]|nr:citrate/2-methylcitrate synthase [Coriobacteriaceae bacterium]